VTVAFIVFVIGVLPAAVILAAVYFAGSDRVDAETARRHAEQLGYLTEMQRCVSHMACLSALAHARAGVSTMDEARMQMDAAWAEWRMQAIEWVEAILRIPGLDDDRKAEAVLALHKLRREDTRPADVDCGSIGVYR
jgi:hypothetical protein